MRKNDRLAAWRNEMGAGRQSRNDSTQRVRAHTERRRARKLRGK
jgi:hypothetical protein